MQPAERMVGPQARNCTGSLWWMVKMGEEQKYLKFSIEGIILGWFLFLPFQSLVEDFLLLITYTFSSALDVIESYRTCDTL